MRALLFVLLLTATATGARAGNYVVACAASCVAADGTTQPAGTVLNRIVADPGFSPGTGLALAPDTGQAVYTPPPKKVTTIGALEFIDRLTPTEQAAFMSANPMWGLQIAAAGTVNVTDPRVITGMAAGVKDGAITQARVTQVLNLAVASP